MTLQKFTNWLSLVVKRKIVFYGNYFLDFYSKLDHSSKEKIDFVLDLIRHVERVPVKFLKHLEGTEGLYEIRIITHIANLRIFCFFDEGKIVVLINGFTKKQQKTPKKELELAKKLRKEYLIEKFERKNK